MQFFTKTAYLLFFCMLALTLELSVRSAGLFLAFLAPFIFYVSIAFSWRAGLCAALIFGSAVDFATGYAFPLSALTSLLALAAAELWLRKIESDSPLLLIFPGALLPLLVYLPQILVRGDGVLTLFAFLPRLFLASIVSSACFPFFVLLFDTLNRKLELDLFVNAKIRRRKEL